jgi:hypothetical protein
MNGAIGKLWIMGCASFGLATAGTALGLGLAPGKGQPAQCDVYRLGVPDFDQKRAGLNSNNGASACIPTSGADWLAYIANHGYPDVFSGPRDWQSPANYDFVTDQLQQLSDQMGVTGKGTNFTHYRETMQPWLDGFYPGKFTVQKIGSHDTYGHTPQELYFIIARGWLPIISFGGYTAYPVPGSGGDIGNPDPDPELHYVRTGGHIVALVNVFDGCGAAPRIGVRNPAGCCGGDIYTQSLFVTESYDLQPITGWFSKNQDNLGKHRTMWRRILKSGDGIQSGDRVSILDGVAIITPTFGLSASPQFGKITYHASVGFGVRQPRSATYDLPGQQPVLGLAQEPARPYAMVLAGDRDEWASLWRLNLVDGTYEQLAQYPQAGPMVFGRHGELYLYSYGALLQLDVGTTPPTERGAVTVNDDAAPAAMAYDDVADTLLFLTKDRSQIGVVPYDDLSQLHFAAWPKLQGSSGNVSMSVSPEGGSLWVTTDAEDVIFRLGLNSAGQWQSDEIVDDLSIVAPRNLQVTSRGTLLFTSNGVLRELAKDPNTGTWSPVSDVPFVGQPVGDLFVASSSRAVPAEYSGPTSDVNIVPPPGDGKPASPTDLNGDGVTDHEDFRAFVKAFASDHAKGTTYADFNGDGVVDASDLEEFHTEFKIAVPTPDKLKSGPVTMTGDEFKIAFAAQQGIAKAGTRAGFTISTQLWVVQEGQDAVLGPATYAVVEEAPGASPGDDHMVPLVPQTIPWDRAGGSFAGKALVVVDADLRNPSGKVIAADEYVELEVDLGVMGAP